MAQIKNEIIQKIKEKDEEAMSIFIDEYRNMIYAIALSEVKNVFDAEDLTSEILSKIWSKIEMYDQEKGNFNAWVVTLAYNHIKDFFKKNNKNTSMLELNNELIDKQIDSKEESLELYKGDLERILTNEQYTIFICSIVYHMKNKDIAKILNISLSKCYRLYNETEKIIREYFKRGENNNGKRYFKNH